MKTYFVSDFHLGSPNHAASRVREDKIVRWLDSIQHDAAALYLVGDVFDFWFDYKTVVPKGYIRLLGRLASWRDAGIPIYFFIGNHDMWMFRYFEEELDIPIYKEPIVREIQGKTFFIAHGDGLGPKDFKYKLLKKIFRNPLCQWLFRWIHPDWGTGLASYLSRKSRANQDPKEVFLGQENEWLYLYANRKLDTIPADFYVFGHRHLPLEMTLKNDKSRYINLGEWLYHCSYAVFDGEIMELRYFNEKD